MGRVVARTLANVMLSYFKTFILLPSDKNALWSRAYHVPLGTWWAGEGMTEFVPVSWRQAMQSRCSSGGSYRRSHRRVPREMGTNGHGPDPASPSGGSPGGQIRTRHLRQNPSPGQNQGSARLHCAPSFLRRPRTDLGWDLPHLQFLNFGSS